MSGTSAYPIPLPFAGSPRRAAWLRSRLRPTPDLPPSPLAGRPAPPKPWERAGAGGAVTASPAEGLPKPWEVPGAGTTTVVPALTAHAGAAGPSGVAQQQQPQRPWERAGGTADNPVGVGAYGATGAYGAAGAGYGGYGGAGYNSYGGVGGVSSMYGAGGAYGRPGFAAGGYGGYGGYGGGGGGYGGMSSMYGAGSMYGVGGGMYGRPGMLGAPGQIYGAGADPNAPAPPPAWHAMLAAVGGVVHFFGRLSFLVDENAHAVHFFVTALLSLLDRFGALYGELARFVLRLLGLRPRDGSKPPGAGDAPAAAGGAPAPFERVWRAPHS
jgi:peroxin-13